MILLDQQLPDGEGISLLPRLLEVRPGAGVIMMTGQHDLDLAILAIKAGAADFIHKPVKAATLQATVEKVLAGQAPEPEHVPAANVTVPWVTSSGAAMQCSRSASRSRCLRRMPRPC